MPAVLMSQKISLTAGFTTFSFNSEVQSFVYGIQEFTVSHGSKTRHELATFKIDLSHQKDGQKITVTANVKFENGTGKGLSKSDSFVVVTMLAWIKDDPSSDVFFGNFSNIKTNSDSPVVQLPQTPVDLNGVISGFNMSYGGAGSGKYVRSINTSISPNRSGQNASLHAVTNFTNKNQKTPTTANVNGGMIATYSSNPGFEIVVVNASSTSEQNVTFSQPVQQPFLMVTSYHATFGNPAYRPNNVKLVGSLTGSGTTWTIKPNFQISNGHNRKTSSFNVQMLAIGVYAS